jgi:hypothetical protein
MVRGTFAAPALTVILLLAAGRAPCEEHSMSFTQVTGRDTILYSEVIRASGAGYEAAVESPRERNAVRLDGSRGTVGWLIAFPSEGMEIEAERRGDTVVVSGKYRGRPYERSFSLAGDPWYQFQELSLDVLHASGRSPVHFWTIDRRNLKPVRFRAERHGEELLTVLGKPALAICYDMTIAGVPAVVFRARFWLRASDGRYLRLEVPGFLGQEASSTVELTADSGL